jgi:membrane-associated phospholipid phosphatase
MKDGLSQDCYSLSMVKSTKKKGMWILGAAFVAFSGAVALGWMDKMDSEMLWISQEHFFSTALDTILSFCSLLGTIRITGVILLVLLVALTLRGQKVFTRRLLIAFVSTGLMELMLKLYLPNVPPPPSQEGVHTHYFETLEHTSITDIISRNTYSYPSGHVLRGVILLGTLYFLSSNRLLRTGTVLVLLGIGVSRIYFDAHWVSDVIGGALLGAIALLWVFGRERGLDA